MNTATLEAMSIGYVFQFEGHGAFAPGGKVEMDPDQIKGHNAQLDVQTVEAMKATGQAVLYLHRSRVCADGFKRDHVGTWTGGQCWPVQNQNTSRHNIGGKRLDLWFVGPDGQNWHGVNIGDNDIVRCRRNKS